MFLTNQILLIWFKLSHFAAYLLNFQNDFTVPMKKVLNCSRFDSIPFVGVIQENIDI